MRAQIHHQLWVGELAGLGGPTKTRLCEQGGQSCIPAVLAEDV